MNPRRSFLFLSIVGIIVVPTVSLATAPKDRANAVRPSTSVERPAEKVQDNILRIAKENAERLAENILQRFDDFEARVQSSPRFSDATKEVLQKNIDADRAFITAKLAEVQSAETPQELRAIIREVLNYMRDRRSEGQQYHEAAKKQFAASIDDMGKKNDAMVEKIEEVIAKLRAKGLDTSSVTSALEDYKNTITALRETDVATRPQDFRAALEDVRTAFRALVVALQSVIVTRPVASIRP